MRRSDFCPRCLFLAFRANLRRLWAGLADNSIQFSQPDYGQLTSFDEMTLKRNIPFGLLPEKCQKCGKALYPVDSESRCPRCTKQVTRQQNLEHLLREVEDQGRIHYLWCCQQLAFPAHIFKYLTPGTSQFYLAARGIGQIAEFPNVHLRDLPLFGGSLQYVLIGEHCLENEHDEKWVSERTCVKLVSRLLGKVAQRQWSPVWLKNSDTGAPLFVDAYFPYENLAVEYQGEQHSMPVEFFGGEAAFQRRVALDEIKRSLLVAHGVRVVYVNHDELQEDCIKKKVAAVLSPGDSRATNGGQQN